jgi:hypothetical protein
MLVIPGDVVSGFLSLPNGKNFPVRDGLTIGRVTGCDIVLDDHKSSRRHARLVVEGGVVEVEDLGSSNGTLLNGKPVTRRVLRPGDKIQIGATVLTFAEGAPGAAAAPDRQVQAARPPAASSDDEVDLFGGDEPAATGTREQPAPAPPIPAPAARPPVQPPNLTTAPPLRVEPSKPARVPAPTSPSPPPPPAEVVEFADEVVEVRQAARPEPAVTARSKAPAPAPGGSGIDQKQRVLQFHKQSGKGGLLGDDLGQMSGGKRALIGVAVLAGAVALAWLAMKLVG